MKRLPGDEPGQGLVEYALVLVLFAVVIIMSLILLGPSLGEFFAGLLELISR